MLLYKPNAVLGIRSRSHFFYQCDCTSQTLVVPKTKSAFHKENKKWLGSKLFFFILYMSSAFHFETHNLSRRQKSHINARKVAKIHLVSFHISMKLNVSINA